MYLETQIISNTADTITQPYFIDQNSSSTQIQQLSLAVECSVYSFKPKLININYYYHYIILVPTDIQRSTSPNNIALYIGTILFNYIPQLPSYQPIKPYYNHINTILTPHPT